MRRLALLALAAAACHRAPTPSPAPSNQHVTAPPTPVDPAAFLASLDPAQPIDVIVAGDGADSLLGKQRCGYWEWITAEMDGNQMSTWRIQYHSEAPITLIAGDRQVTLDWQKLDAYLAPSFQHDYVRSDVSAPPEVADELARAGAPPSLRAFEYCLVVGRAYHAIAHDDEYELPSPKGPPTTHVNRRLVISDAPIVDGMSSSAETPTFRGFSY